MRGYVDIGQLKGGTGNILGWIKWKLMRLGYRGGTGMNGMRDIKRRDGGGIDIRVSDNFKGMKGTKGGSAKGVSENI